MRNSYQFIFSPWIQLGTSPQIEWFSWSWWWQWLRSHPLVPHHLGTTDSKPCTFRGVGHISPSDWLAQNTCWWFQRQSAARGRPFQQRSRAHKWPVGSEYAGTVPSWSVVKQGITSIKNKQTLWCSKQSSLVPRLTRLLSFSRLYFFQTRPLVSSPSERGEIDSEGYLCARNSKSASALHLSSTRGHN